MSDVVHGGASRLERHVGRLLHAYPPAYRADRSEEITGTLLEATPTGRDWPPAREAASVIGGGLRARRAANLRQGLPASLRQAAILGAAVYLVQFSCLALGEAILMARRGFFPLDPGSSFDGSLLLPGLLVMLILAAVWSGRRWLVGAAAAVSATPAVARFLITHYRDLTLVLAIFVGPSLAVFVLLVKRAERLPVSLLWFVCLPAGVTFVEAISTPYPRLLEVLSGSTAERIFFFPYTTTLSLVTVLVAVCWLATDVRPLAGVVFAFAATRALFGLAYARSYGAPGPALIAIAITVPLVLGCALVWLLRRQARSSPPAAS